MYNIEKPSSVRHSAFHIPHCAARIMHCALAMSVASATAIAVRAAEVAHFVEYIETDGAGSTAGEYVLLEYKPTAQSVVEMDFVPLDLSVNNALFCARGAYVTYRPFTLIWYAGSGLRWDYNGCDST